jgi:allophanate hydrolase
MAMPETDVLGWSINEHLEARRRGVSAVDTINSVLAALTVAATSDPALLIGAPLVDLARQLAAAADQQTVDALPLHGVPFLVKDNIDIAGIETTCGCPSYAYIPTTSAEIIARLTSAGAIPVGKTNLDQFATGLVGTRSPHGTPRNPLDPSLIPGGSSSGSAVGVALGIVPFSLGTDTAGSGRVPAAMCAIVGLKPTVGRFPSRGIVPAVRRIDCPTVFARSVADARLVAGLVSGVDATDPYSLPARPYRSAIRSIGVPNNMAELRELMEPDAFTAYESVVASAGSHFAIVPIEINDFLEAGKLLYQGTFVAERTVAVGDFLKGHPVDADPTVSSIIEAGFALSAVDAYACEYRLAELRSITQQCWGSVDALLLPTTPGVATLTDVARDPIGANARMGTFTTFANLLDLAAVAFPLGTRADGYPFGVQLISPAWMDDALADAVEVLVGNENDGGSAVQLSARPGEVLLVVVGAHLSGMALNGQLTTRGARLVAASQTAPCYQLFALAGTVPPKPGLRKVEQGGSSIAVETWALSTEAFGSFVAEIPAPLGIGSIELIDGTWQRGFICEPLGFVDAVDITSFGGWRAYREQVGT